MYTREGGQLQRLFNHRYHGYTIAKALRIEVSAMGVSRVFFAALLLFLAVSAVNAYTVVMRDGRRVEIPNEFTVSKSTLTYVVGNGIQVTIQLNTVDVAATERANGEAQGSFLMKATAPKVAVEPALQTGRLRSVTNADLEKYRRTRVESEKEYETRSRELGLPSLEDRRREAAEIQDRTVDQVRNMRAQEEAYWRSRADALRAEAAANEAQFGAVRQPMQEFPWAYPYGGFPSAWPFDGFGFGITTGPFNRFRRFPSSPFDGFLATPITPFPTFPFNPGFRGRGRLIFQAPRVINPRPLPMRHGPRR
jgi:hypothetical protein